MYENSNNTENQELVLVPGFSTENDCPSSLEWILRIDLNSETTSILGRVSRVASLATSSSLELFLVYECINGL